MFWHAFDVREEYFSGKSGDKVGILLKGEGAMNPRGPGSTSTDHKLTSLLEDVSD